MNQEKATKSIKAMMLIIIGLVFIAAIISYL